MILCAPLFQKAPPGLAVQFQKSIETTSEWLILETAHWKTLSCCCCTLDRGKCSQAKDDCINFPTPCPDIDKGWYGGNSTHMPTQFYPPDDNRHEGWCSGDWTLGMISDKVVIPEDIKPGKYVVSWRWDCEETAQVWQNCADVNILPHKK